jgi:predicted O-linked N-acetylglucosamine transferase (SPINDLY family)
MDYFVGGAAVEDGLRRYSERLILLPGLGVASNEPPIVNVQRSRPLDDAECHFVSLSSYDKIHGGVLATWDGILGGVPRARLDVYCGMSAEESRQLTELGRSVMPHGVAYQVRPALPRRTLLERLAEADVALDSYPFSGFNSLVDALSMSIPVVTLETPGAAGRFGSAVIRALGLQEHLVAQGPAEYIALATRLAKDPTLRRDLRQQLTRERVLAALCDPHAADHFDAALEWMQSQGPNNPGPPVLIQAGEPVRVLGA